MTDRSIQLLLLSVFHPCLSVARFSLTPASLACDGRSRAGRGFRSSSVAVASEGRLRRRRLHQGRRRDEGDRGHRRWPQGGLSPALHDRAGGVSSPKVDGFSPAFASFSVRSADIDHLTATCLPRFRASFDSAGAKASVTGLRH